MIVQFTDNSDPASASSIIFWCRDFGDKGTSTEQNPSHTYTAAETYTVSLTMISGMGTDTHTAEDYMHVYAVDSWERPYGGADADVGWYVQCTSDGGHIVAEYTGAGGRDMYLVKVDSTGNMAVK